MTPTRLLDGAHFLAPASSANLGPGYDSVAVALELYNELRLAAGNGQIELSGDAVDLPADSSNLVARAFERVAPGIRDQWDIHCINNIPLARGLGSSTAAAALGIMAGWHAAGRPFQRFELYNLLCEFDGHRDNAAACTYGGITIAPPGRITRRPIPIWLQPPAWLRFIAVIPPREVKTKDARAALPATYSAAECVDAVGASATLVAALANNHRQALHSVLHADVLHEQQRAGLVPELEQVRELLRSTQALGATLSGAGPTVLVWVEDNHLEATVAALAPQLADCRVLALPVATAGAVADVVRR